MNVYQQQEYTSERYKSWKLKWTNPTYNGPCFSNRWYERRFYSKELIYKEQSNKSKETEKRIWRISKGNWHEWMFYPWSIMIWDDSERDDNKKRLEKMLTWRRCDNVKKKVQIVWEIQACYFRKNILRMFFYYWISLNLMCSFGLGCVPKCEVSLHKDATIKCNETESKKVMTWNRGDQTLIINTNKLYFLKKIKV